MISRARRWHPLLALPALLLAAASARAQVDSVGRLSGTVYDSVHGRPFAAATVQAVPAGEGGGRIFLGVTDARGRFDIRDVRVGRYGVSVSHPWLDSANVQVPPATVEIRPGQPSTIALAVPSSLSIRRAVCGALRDTTQGAIAGVVRSAERGVPLPLAHVVFQWRDLAVDSTRRAVTSKLLSGNVVADSSGVFRGCGLPIAMQIIVQAQVSGDRSSGPVEAVIGATGVELLTLLVSDVPSTALASSDTAAAPATDSVATQAPETDSRLAVIGRVLGERGEPLRNAQIRLLGTTRSATTDSAGRFRLRGIDAGTQGLEFAAIGYYPTRRRVDVTPAGPASLDVGLRRLATVFDTIHVRARRQYLSSRYPELERRRQMGQGRFFTEEQIERRNLFFTSELFRTVPGVRIAGDGFDARLVATRGGDGCVTLYLDGMRMERPEPNVISASQLFAVEVYSGTAAPAQFGNFGCAVVLLWSK